MAGGFDIYIFGADIINNYPTDTSFWMKVPVLGLNYEHLPYGESQRGQLGGYRHARIKEKTIVLNTKPIPFDDWFDFIDGLTSHLTKPFLYFRKGTYPKLSDNIRLIPTGVSAEHDYNNGTKSIDVECVIYE